MEKVQDGLFQVRGASNIPFKYVEYESDSFLTFVISLQSKCMDCIRMPELIAPPPSSSPCMPMVVALCHHALAAQDRAGRLLSRTNSSF